MPYYRNCNVCGERIIMAKSPRGGWQALDPDHGGRHEHRFRPAATTIHETSPSISDWSIENLPQPLTYETTCFIGNDGNGCGATVIYHTNGNGDCVLFDPPIRLPWKDIIHRCWKLHCRNRRVDGDALLSRLEISLRDKGFDGTYYEPEGTKIVPPDKAHNEPVTCLGFLCSRPIESERIDLSCKGLDPPSWVKFVIREGESLIPFLVPLAIAQRVKPFEMVRVRGRWMRHGDAVLLVAERITILRYPGVASKTIRVVSLGRIKCGYCGRSLSPRTAWGINCSRRVECGKCAELRRNLPPRQFVREIRRIAKHLSGFNRRDG